MRFPLPTATVHHLPNGLTVISDVNHSHPVVSTQLWVATGSLHEGDLLGTGLSHFLEHMVFKGTKNFSAEELPRIVQASGGHWNAYTTFDRTVYYIDGPSSGADRFLEVLTDLVFRAKLPEEDFEMERDVIRREIDMGADDPDNAAMQLLLGTAFRIDARRHPVIGYRPLFDQIKHEDLRNYYDRRYVTNRCHLVISGDYDEEKMLTKIQELTADLVQGMATEPVVPQDPAQCGMRIGLQAFAVTTAKLTLAWKVPALGHPDAPSYDVLASMIGQGQSSPLFHELRETRELCHDISAWCWTSNQGDGLFAVSAECPMEQIDALKAGIKEILSIYAEQASEKDMQRAIRQMTLSQFRSLTSASGRASDLASNWHEARNLRFTGAYLEAANQVTLADIRHCLGNLQDRVLTETLLHPLESKVEAAESTAKDRVAHKEWQMENGIKAAVFPESQVPLVSIQLAVRGGLSADVMEQAGCSALLAATITQGTQRRTARELYEALESLGASISAQVANNSFLLQASCFSSDLPEVMKYLAEITLIPAWDEGAIERERASLIASVEEARQQPVSLAFLNLRSLLFGAQGYGLPASGSAESLAALTRDDLMAMHQKLFHAKNICIGIAGDIDAATTRELLEQYFASSPKDEPAFAPSPSTLHLGTSTTAILDKKQAVLCLAYPGLPTTDERRYALAMLQEYCSDMAGPLFIRIREELGLAYQVGATQFLGHDAGMLAFYLSTSPEQLELAQAEMLQVLATIHSTGIPDDSFEDVRATVLSSLSLQAQSPGSTARNAAIQMLYGQPADHHRRIHQNILALTPTDVRLIAAELMQHSPAVSIVQPQ
jgi:zinc protease